MLCDKCSAIKFRKPDQGNASYFVLHQNKQSLLQSELDGCHFCCLLRGQLGKVELRSQICHRFAAFVVLKMDFLPRADPASMRIPSLSVHSRLGNLWLRSIDDIPGADTTTLHFVSAAATKAKYPLNTESYDRAIANHLEAYQYANHVDSSVFNVDLALLWRDKCLQHHTICKLGSQSSEVAELPTRLVDVADPENPFLAETKALSRLPVQYLALSYCWGEGGKFETRKENYNSHLSRIQRKSLPKTLSDAVLVTHELGYRYIWIDALCIIQDDDQDKSHELGNMGNIYRCAIMTISAKGAVGSHVGFLHNRNPLSLAPCTLNISISTADSSEAASRAVTLTGKSEGPDHVGRRGWVLQEQILSSRSLVFGSQMEWKCLEAKARETDPVLKPLPTLAASHAPSADALRMWLYAPQVIRPLIMGPDHPHNVPRTSTSIAGHHDHCFASWYKTVEEYSDRKLTYQTDTLAALTGLSVLFRQEHDSTYLAGLWKEDTITGLGWYVAHNDNRSLLDFEERDKAPSWTWASVGKVRIRFASLQKSPGLDHEPVSDRAKILGAFCIPDDPIRASAVAPQSLHTPRPTWSLKIQSHAMRLVLRCEAKHSDWRINVRLYTSRGSTDPELQTRFDPLRTSAALQPRFPAMLVSPFNGDKIVGDAALDWPPEALRMWAKHATGTSGGKKTDYETQVVCLSLREAGMGFAVCLLLIPHKPGSHSFRRIGLAYVPSSEWDELQKENGGLSTCEVL